MLPPPLRGYLFGCVVVIVGCSKTTSSAMREIDVSITHGNKPSKRTSLALEPPPNEAWIIVKNRTPWPMLILDKKGGSFGTVNANEEYVVRLPGGDRHRLYAASPNSCFHVECEAPELAVLDVPVLPECVYLAVLAHVWSSDGTLRLAFVQGNLPLALKGPMDLTRVGHPHDAGPTPSDLGQQIAKAGRELTGGQTDWGETFAMCRAQSPPRPDPR